MMNYHITKYEVPQRKFFFKVSILVKSNILVICSLSGRKIVGAFAPSWTSTTYVGGNGNIAAIYSIIA